MENGWFAMRQLIELREEMTQAGIRSRLFEQAVLPHIPFLKNFSR